MQQFLLRDDPTQDMIEDKFQTATVIKAQGGNTSFDSSPLTQKSLKQLEMQSIKLGGGKGDLDMKPKTQIRTDSLPSTAKKTYLTQYQDGLADFGAGNDESP